jgi:hypothetical protein
VTVEAIVPCGDRAELDRPADEHVPAQHGSP